MIIIDAVVPVGYNINTEVSVLSGGEPKNDIVIGE